MLRIKADQADSFLCDSNQGLANKLQQGELLTQEEAQLLWQDFSDMVHRIQILFSAAEQKLILDFYGREKRGKHFYVKLQQVESYYHLLRAHLGELNPTGELKERILNSLFYLSAGQYQWVNQRNQDKFLSRR